MHFVAVGIAAGSVQTVFSAADATEAMPMGLHSLLTVQNITQLCVYVECSETSPLERLKIIFVKVATCVDLARSSSGEH